MKIDGDVATAHLMRRQEEPDLPGAEVFDVCWSTFSSSPVVMGVRLRLGSGGGSVGRE